MAGSERPRRSTRDWVVDSAMVVIAVFAGLLAHREAASRRTD